MSTEPETGCAEKLRVLADPTRLAIVELLLAEPRRVGELSAALEVEQSLLSHHLRVLREHGFVVTRREGKGIRYDLSPDYRSASQSTLDLGCCAIAFDRPAEEPRTEVVCGESSEGCGVGEGSPCHSVLGETP